MKHLEFSPTPINKLDYYSRELGCNIIAKRDDLFAEAGGGSKARMLQYILADVNSSNCDVLVTAGGPCSNFNRACALMCAKIGVPMHLVEYTDTPEEFETSLNYYLCNLAGIRKTRCEKTNVPATIKKVVDSYTGQKVKLIYGGGKSIEGIYAYYAAVKELKEQLSEIDHVFIACSTGTTTTGVCAGMQAYFPNATVHAISTARKFADEMRVLEEDMIMLNEHIEKNFDFQNMVFSEDYLCGGYAKYSQALFSEVKNCISKEGMIIDPTYSGKAFWGMINEIKKSPDTFYGKNILFWNTGGIMNLLSTKK